MAEETQNLEQTLENTGLGHFVNTNKDSILIAAGVVIALIIGISVYKHNSDKNDQLILNKVYSFHKTNIQPYLEQGKDDKKETTVSEDQVINALLSVEIEIIKNPNFLSSLIDVTNKLAESGSAEKLIPLYEKVITNYKPKEYGYYFAALKLAVLYENAQNYEGAIKTLETVVSANHELLKSNIYLDLGRLYKQIGQKDKAKSNFDYIVNNEKNAELVKLAKLFLLQL